MFQKNEYEAATYHFKKLLDAKPENYVALHKLICLQQRAGKLDEAKKFIDSAESNSPRAAHCAGFNFCKGVYAWLSNDPHEALKCLNYARRDGEWGKRAIELVRVKIRMHTDCFYPNP